MSFSAKAFRVLVASPSDVVEERILARQMIEDWNAVNAVTAQTVFLPVMWETHAAPRMGDRPQAIINSQIVDACDALIGIFWTRIGTPTGEAESGSVEEIRRFNKSRKPTMLYFSSRPVVLDNLDHEQWQRLVTFRNECAKSGLIDRYDSLPDLARKLSRHLVSLGHELAGVETPALNPGVGQYPGMVYQVVAANQAGWGYLQGVNVPIDSSRK